jgi:DNA-binding ferritin-like protein
MFDNLKKAILAKRIKKCAEPTANIILDGIVIYERMFHNILQLTQVIVREVEPLVEKHADKIAEAVVLLEPMLKEMKELNSLKTIENQDTFLTEDEVVKQAVKNIKEFAAEVKAYSKEV